MSKVSVRVSEAVDKELEYTVSDEVTGGGNGGEPKCYKLIEAANYTIALWPVKANNNTEKKAEIAFNARVTCKNAFNGEGIHISFPVKRILDSGELLAGQSSKLSGQRDIVTQYKAGETGGKSYSLTSIPLSAYKEVMAIIADATDEKVEEAAEAAAE